jgi:hypothetical protein
MNTRQFQKSQQWEDTSGERLEHRNCSTPLNHLKEPSWPVLPEWTSRVISA